MSLHVPNCMNVVTRFRPYLKHLIWPGLALTTAGLVAGILSGWTPLPLGLFIVGILLLGLGIGSSDVVHAAFWQRRSTQAGANGLVTVIAILVILGLINFLAVRYSARIDLTENQLFTLAPQSEAVAKSIPQPVRILIFDTAPNPQDKQLLDSYRRANTKITYDYINPYVDLQLSQSFGVTSPGQVFVVLGDTHRPVQKVSTSERLSERELTNQLDQLFRQRDLTVYFLTGHGEYLMDGTETGVANAAQALSDKNYVVKPLDLGQEKAVPQDASVVVVAGPQKELFAAEVKAIQAYLDRGGSILLMLDPKTNPGWDSILDQWGVTLDDRLVVDTSGEGQVFGLGPLAPLITNYGNHPITQDFRGGRSFYPLARPLEIQEVPQVTATPLLLTNPESQSGEASDEGELQFDPASAPRGPFVLGVALSRPVEPTPDKAESTEVDGTETDGADSASAASTPGDAAGSESGSETDSEANAEASTPTRDESTSTPEAASESSPAEAETTETTETQNAEDRAAAESTPSTNPENPENPEEVAEPIKSSEARLVVIGNSSFATDGLFGQVLNGDVFLNSVSWLGQQNDQVLSIRPKTATSRRILMTLQHRIMVGLFAVLILPGLGFLGALIMWIRRR